MATQHFRLLAALAVSVVAALPASNAYASGCAVPKGNFALSLDVSSVCSYASANTAQALFDNLSTSGLQSLGNNYTGTQVATVNADFNSLMMYLAFPNAGSTGTGAQLVLTIPGLGVSQTFTGANRDASKEQLVDYLKHNDILGQIMKYQAANSPTSPIAGTGGMLPNAVSSDFNQNFTDTATRIASPTSAASAASQNNIAPNLIGISLSYGSLTSLDDTIKVMTLPLSYTIRNDIDPRRQLILSMPITQIDTNGAKSYNVALGGAYRFPMNDNWTLTPSGKVSGVGSVDMATVAGMYSLSLTSTYIWEFDSYDVSMGNMLSYNKTMKFKSGDYAFDPDIQSTVLRNGVLFSQPVNWGGKKLSVEYSAIDTRYTGTKLYIDNTQEFGVSVGTNKSAFSARSFLRGGLVYLHGKDTKGVTANIGYWF